MRLVEKRFEPGIDLLGGRRIRVGLLRGETRGQHFELDDDAEEILDLATIERLHLRPALRLHDDQPLEAQLQQRLADRGAADTEVFGGLTVPNDLAGRTESIDNKLPQVTQDGLARGFGRLVDDEI